MGDLAAAAKVAADLGGTGVMVVLLVLMYRLLDSHLKASAASQEKQANAQDRQADAMSRQATATAEQSAAMTSLASAVRESQQDQRDVLIAVRVLADRLEGQRGYLVSIERDVQELRMARGVSA